MTYYGVGKYAGMTVQVKTLPDGTRLYSVNGGPYLTAAEVTHG